MTVTDYTGRCGNCHAPFLSRKDRFCHVCGTRKGKGTFEPFVPYEIWSDDTEAVRFYRCLECEYEWHTDSLNPDEKNSYYCPTCGKMDIQLEDTFVG